MTVPAVLANEFAVTSGPDSTTCGWDADRPASTNRFIATTESAAARKTTSSRPYQTEIAAGTTATTRTRLATASAERRLHLSRNTPTNGPSSEYGSNSTANAAGMATGLAAPSGVNSPLPARPAWHQPS